MVKGNEASASLQSLYAAAAFVIVVAGMKAAAPLVVPFLLAAFIAIICAPALYWLQEKGLPTAVALLIVITAVGLVSLGVVGFVGSSLASFTRDLPQYTDRLSEMTNTVGSNLQVVEDWLIQNGWMKAPAENAEHESTVKSVMDSLDLGAAMKFFNNIVLGLSGVFGNVFLILLTVIFILLEAAGFPAKIRSLSGDTDDGLRNFDRIVTDVRRYVAMKTKISLVTSLLAIVLLLWIGVDYPLLWGLLVFLLNYVPNIGSFIAAVPPVLLAVVQLGWGDAVITAIGFVVINVVMGNVIEPRVMGKGLGLSTLVVFVSLVFWGWALGPIGMLLSAPLTMVAKIALESRPDTRWMAVLLSSDAAADCVAERQQAER